MSDHDRLAGGDRRPYQEPTAQTDASEAGLDRYTLQVYPETLKGNPDNKPKGDPIQVVGAKPWRIMSELQELFSPFNNRGQTICTFQSRDEGGENLTAIVRCLSPAEYIGSNTTTDPNPDNCNPYVGVFVAGTVPDGTLQTIVPVAQLIYGFDGITESLAFNLPFNQYIKVPVNGNSVRIAVYMQQKYFPLLTGSNPPGVTGTWLETTDDYRRNMLFDAIPPIVGSAGFPRTGKVKFQGTLARGLLNPVGADKDRSARIIRRFDGILPQGSVKGATFRIPVPRGAVAACLLGDDTNEAIQTVVGAPLYWAQNNQNDGTTLVNYAAGTFFALRDGCTSIDVYPKANLPARPVPFEMIYDLGF